MKKTNQEIRIRAAEIENTCAMEYPEAGEEAIYQMALDMKSLGWHPKDVGRLLNQLGF